MRATYNITNDKLKFWPNEGERLSKEQYEYATRRCRFVWWHGSKCFVAKWNPEAEDFIREKGVEIEDDDTPDNVESRVERFEKYADRAQDQAASGEARLETANTDRRREFALAAREKGLSEAEHWQRRIQGAIRHAAYKEQPDVIARRIRGLEADRRRHVASYTIKSEHGEGVIVGGGRGGHWRKREELPAIEAWAKRWIAHLDRRLEYENASLEAAGGAYDVLRPKRKVAVQPKGKAKARDGKALEVGGAAAFNRGYSSDITWRFIIEVNRSTFRYLSISEVLSGGETEKQYHVMKSSKWDAITSKTPEEAKAAMPEDFQHFEKVQAILQRRAEAKKAKRTEAAKVDAETREPVLPGVTV